MEFTDTRPAFPLDGYLERERYAPTLTAWLGLVLAFVLFQVVIAPVAIVFLLLGKGVPPEGLLEAFGQLAEAHTREMLVANTIGQVLGIALPAWLLARLHTSRPAALLRLGAVPWAAVVVACVGLLALTPLIQWLAALNQSIPLPRFLESFEATQIELIERILARESNLSFNLIVIALTPALCEELLFRGYFQRQVERGRGVVAGVLASGIVFGLYHLRLSQAIPLSVLGLYLAYLTWRTASLWPAIVVHFLNNGLAVVASAVLARREGGAQALEEVAVPWWGVLLGLAVAGLCFQWLERQGAAPPPVPSLSAHTGGSHV